MSRISTSITRAINATRLCHAGNLDHVITTFRRLRHDIIGYLSTRTSTIRQRFKRRLRMFQARIVQVNFGYCFVTVLRPVGPTSNIRCFPRVLFIRLQEDASAGMRHLGELSFRMDVSRFRLFTRYFSMTSFPFTSHH